MPRRMSRRMPDGERAASQVQRIALGQQSGRRRSLHMSYIFHIVAFREAVSLDGVDAPICEVMQAADVVPMVIRAERHQRLIGRWEQLTAGSRQIATAHASVYQRRAVGTLDQIEIDALDIVFRHNAPDGVLQRPDAGRKLTGSEPIALLALHGCAPLSLSQLLTGKAL